jgi:FdhD protein
MPHQVEHISIKKISSKEIIETTDQVAVEEPLEIQLVWSTGGGRMRRNIAVTVRTPGNEAELAAGFLFTEGIIANAGAIDHIKVTAGANTVLVTLRENVVPLLQNSERNFYSTSSCGICGKASIDAVKTVAAFENEADNISIPATVLFNLPQRLKEQQDIFEHTGGIHASGLFSLNGTFILLREDVGRHNALDKLIGAVMLAGGLPMHDSILLLSGRASFELLQKAAMAGIKIVASVGAPSSMAVDMAKDAHITLAGFLRDGRCNLYSGFQRIVL